jgi:hypothetical protein
MAFLKNSFVRIEVQTGGRWLLVDIENRKTYPSSSECYDLMFIFEANHCSQVDTTERNNWVFKYKCVYRRVITTPIRTLGHQQQLAARMQHLHVGDIIFRIATSEKDDLLVANLHE